MCLLTACYSPPQRPIQPTPEVAVVVAWPLGTSFVTAVTSNLPDRPEWRAVPIWWQEAMRQTESFSLAEARLADTEDLPRLELTLDPRPHTLQVTLHAGSARTGSSSTVLVSMTLAASDASPDWCQAIDEIAWRTRLALGEAASQPFPVAAITSRQPSVAVAVQDAILLMQTGGFAAAHRALRIARQRDGGAPFVLDRIAEIELLRGNSEVAERTCHEALTYGERVSATVQHRLARTLLMARAQKEPSDAPSYDRQLATLAAVARRERPYDEEPVWTAALAHNFLGEYAEARPLLEKLLLRWPENAFVAYHLGWACLGMDDATAAVRHLATAGLRLPAPWLLLPRAIALYEAGLHEELQALLQTVLDEYGSDSNDSINHSVLRMQAAHAILQNQPQLASRLLFEDLQWLQTHPLMLAARAGEFAEAGALLVRLGSNQNLPLLLASVQSQHPGSLVADASSYVGGMHHVQTTGTRPVKLEQMLARDGDSAWSSLLRAYYHERHGEVGDMQNQLAIAARLSDSPMTKALLAQSLRAVGKMQEAERLQETLRRELVQIHLRRTCQHPMFGPELAYAFVLH